MQNRNYFLPDGYVANNEGKNISIDEHSYYDSQTSYWSEERINLSMSYQQPIYRYIAKQVTKNSNVIDVGCGVGVKLNNIIGRKSLNLYGVDQPSAIEKASKLFNIPNFSDVDFDNESSWNSVPEDIDFIICSDVIEHLEKPENLLNYIKFISSEGTRIFISTPNRDRVRGCNNLQSPNLAHVREWNDAEFSLFVSSLGLKVKNVSHHLPYKLLSHGIVNSARDFLTIKFQNKGNFFYNMLFELTN